MGLFNAGNCVGPVCCLGPGVLCLLRNTWCKGGGGGKGGRRRSEFGMMGGIASGRLNVSLDLLGKLLGM
eukprot:203390-Pelagomonas_calceolata.AAC.1